MIILNTFKFKIGSGGRRNRAARRRLERRGHVATPKPQHSSLPKDLCNEDFGLVGTKPDVLDVKTISQRQSEQKPDLSGVWDEVIAKKAIALFEKSGKSQKAFAAEHGFSDSKLRSWKKKLETSAV